jgi:hypothetical protein
MDQEEKSKQSVQHKITKRDLLMLKFILDDRQNTYETIRKKFWPGKNNHHHFRRLRILQDMGLISPRFAVGFSGRVFRLTKKGRKKLVGPQAA